MIPTHGTVQFYNTLLLILLMIGVIDGGNRETKRRCCALISGHGWSWWQSGLQLADLALSARAPWCCGRSCNQGWAHWLRWVLLWWYMLQVTIRKNNKYYFVGWRLD